MIKVHYEHPPRKWDFYLLYVAYIIAFLSPFLIAALTWSFVPTLFHLFVGFSYLVLWGLLFFRRVSSFFLIRYDRDVNKAYEVTDKNLPIPNYLIEPVEAAKRLDFTIAAIWHDYSILGADPIADYAMKNSDGEIWIQILEVKGQTPYIIHFLTAFENNRFVQTAYPFYDNVESPNYVFDSVSNSIEDCYKVHINNVAKFANHAGEPRKITSVDQFNKLLEIREGISRETVIINMRVRVGVVFMLVSLLLATSLYLLVNLFASRFIPMQVPLYTLLLSLAYFITSLLVIVNILPKGRDISQAKKKAS